MTSMSRSRIGWQSCRTLKILGAVLLSATIHNVSIANEQITSNQGDLSALLEQLHKLRTEVENRQYALGAYNEELLTSLSALAEALISADAWQEAVAAVEQQIQIVRINDGLYTDAQIPLIAQQLSILAAQKDWATISDRMVYMLLLLQRAEQMPVETKLAHLKQMRDWSRLLLTQGPRHQEPVYLLQLQALEETALEFASTHGLDTETMQTLIYDRATAELYIALGIVATSETSRQLLSRTEGNESSYLRRGQPLVTVSDIEAVYGPRASTVIERSHRMVMARHQQMISSLADPTGNNSDQALVEMESSDPEQAAMIKLSLGDSVLLRQQYELRIGRHTGPARGSSNAGSAARYYEDAWGLLLKAGFSADQLNDYFSCPTLLPANQFSRKLGFEPDQQPASCSSGPENIKTLPDTAVVRGGVPGLRYENMGDLGLMTAAEGVKAVLQFSIGMNGQPERIRIQAAEPETTGSRIRGKQALETLQFRPALRDGRPVRTDEAIINIYSLAPG
ncbi:MAG: hypothetical protein Q8K97_11485 [Pseudohongiella sp.]|nr:hypothetical protein [Pseudohongiella sp.]MDP2127987.1 hypothetical protein [Pseudohongiella sp.]